MTRENQLQPITLGEPMAIQVAVKGESEILLGYQPIRLTKEFGPTIFMGLRIRADAEACEWIVERETNDGWQEWARIPGQLDSDFTDDKATDAAPLH